MTRSSVSVMQLCSLGIALGAVVGCSNLNSQADHLPKAAVNGPHQISVNLTGLPCCDYPVRLGVFDQAEDWLKQHRILKARLVISGPSQQRLVLYGLPAGRYAIAAFVDRNGNGRLDRWFGLIPREPLAYSVVSLRKLPPSFEQSSFRVPSSHAVVVAFK